MLCAFLFTHGQARELIPPFKSVAKGVEFRRVQLERPRPITILQLRCDPTAVDFHLLMADDKSGPEITTADEMVKRFGLLAAINSSYFGHANELLGYAERKGHVLNSQVAQDSVFSAFFYWDGRRAGFKRRGEALPKNVPVLFQAGPRLVWESEAVGGLESKALANRSAIVKDSAGRISLVAIGAASKVTLAELPELLLLAESKGGLEAVRALNVDGGKSTQFCLRTPVEKTFLPGFVKVPVFLGVTAR